MSKPEQMTKIAAKHYDSLQVDGTLEVEDHEAAIADALAPLTARLTSQQKAPLAKRIGRAEIEEAVRESARGKAPGLDGIPAEVWKAYLQWEHEDENKDRCPFRLTQMLRLVFNDVEQRACS